MLSDLLCCFTGVRARDSANISSSSSRSTTRLSYDKQVASMMTHNDPSIHTGQDVGTLEKCTFCNPSPDDFDIVLQDERFVVFTDRSPAAQVHLLAVPRWHVENVKYLRGEKGAELVKDLLDIGSRALDLVDAQQRHTRAWSSEAKETRFGFHIYPFNSVNHIHLHCLALPFTSSVKALKYRLAPGNPGASPPTHKGWGWFITAEQSVAILRDGGTIHIEPC